MKTSHPHHIVIFEPRLEGHHLSWLCYIAEDFLSAGFKVTLATDTRSEIQPFSQDQLSSIAGRVDTIPVFDNRGRFRNGNRMNTLSACLNESGADEIFLPNFDEIASNCLRLASIGIFPPANVKGRLSGIYHRPRSLATPCWPPGNIIKSFGFRRLGQQGWFRNIFLLDEYLIKNIIDVSKGTRISLIPDPCCGDFSHERNEARRRLGIPLDKFVFLSYGIPARRKGLHIAVEAMADLPSESRLFLLCGGKILKSPDITDGLGRLAEKGLAMVMDRYISDLEEKLCFCASDAILLPYIKHFGSSAILSRAAAAGKMVIASNEGLIKMRVQEHQLGLLFESRSSKALRSAMEKAALLSASEMEAFKQSALDYTKFCSRDTFRKRLLQPYEAI